MGLQINTNIAAMNAYRNLSSTQNAMSTSLERLSSGLRINRAADDAAGLAISEKLRAQATGLNQATSNAQDGISLIQTAEGALNETHSILQRMRQLAVQSANDTNSDGDRLAIQSEVDQLAKELNRIGNTTQFNGANLLQGNAVDNSTAAVGTKAVTFQVGANAGQSLTVNIGDSRGGALGVAFTTAGTQAVAATLGSVGPPAVAPTSAVGPIAQAAGFTYDENAVGIDVSSSQAAATSALTAIDKAIGTVSTQRASLGAAQNRLQHTVNSLSVAAENASAAESRIRDTDMAKEMTSFTRSQILAQAGVSMLAQANSAPQSVLKLLG
jgi:flagellin